MSFLVQKIKAIIDYICDVIRGAHFLAAQKKKTVKKTKKPKVEPKKEIQEPDSYFITMMVGYLVLLAGIILLLGCVTISIVGEHENWLGDYFGVMFPSFMTFLFGRVAIVSLFP